MTRNIRTHLTFPVSFDQSIHMQVLMERPGDLVVHVKSTVLLLPSGTTKVTGLPFSTTGIVSEKELPEDIKAILATSSKTNSKKKKKNKDKKTGEVMES